MNERMNQRVDTTLPRGTCSGAARATTLPRRATTRRRVCGPWTRLSLGASWWVTSPTWTAWRGIPTPTTSPRVRRIAPSDYGTCRRASACASSRDTAGGCAAWPCRPMVNPWRVGQTTAGYRPMHPTGSVTLRRLDSPQPRVCRLISHHPPIVRPYVPIHHVHVYTVPR